MRTLADMTALPPTAIFSAAFSWLALTHCASPSSAHADEAEDKPAVFTGCIGQTFENCVASVSRYIPDVSSPSEPDFSPDIQGKRPTSGHAHFHAVSSEPQQRVAYEFLLDFGPKQRITSVRVVIMGDTDASARTEAEYETTGIYEALSGATRSACPKSEEAFYKAFDSYTRGKLTFHKGRHEAKSKYPDDFATSKPFDICGLTVRYSVYGLKAVNPRLMLDLGLRADKAPSTFR